VLILGGLLLLSSFMSICGLTYDSCRCTLCLSAWLAIPVAALEVIIAVRPSLRVYCDAPSASVLRSSNLAVNGIVSTTTSPLVSDGA
jgi:hypothetical protein